MADAQQGRLAVLLEQFAQARAAAEHLHQGIDRDVAEVGSLRVRVWGGGGAGFSRAGGHAVQLDNHAESHTVVVKGDDLVAGIADEDALTIVLEHPVHAGRFQRIHPGFCLLTVSEGQGFCLCITELVYVFDRHLIGAVSQGNDIQDRRISPLLALPGEGAVLPLGADDGGRKAFQRVPQGLRVDVIEVGSKQRGDGVLVIAVELDGTQGIVLQLNGDDARGLIHGHDGARDGFPAARLWIALLSGCQAGRGQDKGQREHENECRSSYPSHVASFTMTAANDRWSQPPARF